MVFQGGYSPNSINPLPKFKGIKEVQSFNPSGAKEDFNLLLKSSDIIYKRYVGKNVCHGYTNSDLRTIWEPSAKKVSQFWNMLKDKKAMHDVLAAQCMLNLGLHLEACSRYSSIYLSRYYNLLWLQCHTI